MINPARMTFRRASANVMAAALLGCAHAVQPTVPTPGGAVVIPLRRVDGSNLRSVTVAIAGDTTQFLFDTGNGTTLIDSTVAARIHCTPRGNGVGFRMSGEKLAGPRCENVAVQMGGIGSIGRAGVVDMRKLLDRPNTKLHGVVSLANFRGHIVTLDLAHDQLVIETSSSVGARVAAMSEIPMRIATGIAGEDLDVFIGARHGDDTLWMEWDSGHQASTFIAPHALKAIGLEDSTRRADGLITFGGEPVVVPVQVRDILYDGVLSAAFMARAVWTADLAAGRMWVGPVAPIVSLSAVGAAPVAESKDATGDYEITTTFGENVQHSVMRIYRDSSGLRGEIRGAGEDGAVALRNVHASGSVLQYELPLRQPMTVSLTFDGNVGRGDWDLAGKPAHTTAVKRN